LRFTRLRTTSESFALLLIREEAEEQSNIDSGRSGRTIKKRKELQALLDIVQPSQADFNQILVYDVSRWGRFPDSDESAHYEYLCKKAGITVHYCAEQFENDNSATSNLLKALRRTMAAEYSRQLAVKVSTGHLIHVARDKRGLPNSGHSRPK